MCHGHTASQCFTCGVNEVMKLLSSLLPVFLALAAVNSNADLLFFDTDEICISSGTRLSVICHSQSTSALNSSFISFSFHLPTGETVLCQRSPCQCDIINATSIHLICYYLPVEYDNGNLGCYSQDDPSISVRASVHVRVRPCVLRIVSYEVVHWNTLQFHWQLNSTLLPVHSTAWFKNSMNSEYTRCTQMPLLLPSSSSSTSLLGSCTVDGVFDHAAPDRVMHIKVNGSFGACICVDEHVVQLNRIINPGPVLHLHLQKSAANADSVLIQFSSPRLGSVFRYSVNVTCSPDNFTWTRDIAATQGRQLSVEVTSVPADCSCNVSVAAKYSDSVFWGPNAFAGFETPPQVPLSGPEVDPNGFEIQSSTSRTRNVVVYFKPLSHRLACGTLLSYRVNVISQGRSTRLTFPVTNSQSLSSVNLSELASDVEYFITIDASTQAGYNDSLHLRTIYIPTSADVPVIESNSLSVVMLSAEWLAYCTWKPLNEFQFTLFWCETTNDSRSARCKAGISWTKLPSDVSAYNISLHSSAVTAASKFIFGISAENHLRLRTGIIWNSHVYSFYSESSLHDSAASDINSNTVVMVPSGSLDVDGTVTMLGIFVLLLLAFIIVTSIVFAFRFCVGRIKAVDEGLKKQSLVHEVDTAQTLMTSERHEMLDVPSITITWPQLRAECIQSCEEAAVISEEDDFDPKASSLSAAAADLSHAGPPRILPTVSDVLLPHENCQQLHDTLLDDIGDVPMARKKSSCSSSVGDACSSVLCDVSSDNSVNGSEPICHSRDSNSHIDFNSWSADCQGSEKMQKLLPSLGNGGVNADSVTVADIHAVADSLPVDKLLSMSPCGSTNVDNMGVSERLPWDKLLPSLGDGGSENVNTFAVADIHATADTLPENKMLCVSSNSSMNVDNDAVNDSFSEDKLLPLLHDGPNVDSVTAADTLQQDKLLPLLSSGKNPSEDRQ